MNFFSSRTVAATLCILLLWCTSANATLITYKLSAGPITNAGFDISLGDTVTAIVQLDNTQEDAAALVSFMMDITGQNWTEANVDYVLNISFIAGELDDLNIQFLIPGFASMRWATNNTWSIFDETPSNKFVYCNSCVSFERYTEPETTPVPEPGTIALLVISLLGVRSVRKMKRL